MDTFINDAIMLLMTIFVFEVLFRFMRFMKKENRLSRKFERQVEYTQFKHR